MIPRVNRIRVSEFEELSGGPSLSLPHLALKYKVSPQGGHPKCAVVISSKIAPKAVSRNRIRRALYKALEELLLKIPKGGRLIVYLKKEGRTASVEEFRGELRGGLEKLLK